SFRGQGTSPHARLHFHCLTLTAVPSLQRYLRQPSRRLVETVRCTPMGLVERLAGLHDMEQQRHELPRNGAHGAYPTSAVPRPQRFVLSAVEPALLPPAAGQEEELPPEQGPSALGLPWPTVNREPRIAGLDQVHPGQLQDLARRYERLRRAEFADQRRSAHYADA